MTKRALFLAIACGLFAIVGGCAGGAQPAPRAALARAVDLPESVMVDRLRFAVEPLPGQKGFLLQVRFLTSDASQPPQRPATESDYRQAAEQALPPGCRIVGMEKTPDAAYYVVFACDDAGLVAGEKPATNSDTKPSADKPGG